MFVTDELPRSGAAGHLALNHAIITWLQAQGHEVSILLTGARLSGPVQPYTAAEVAGPHIRQVGKRVFATSLVAISRLLARAALRYLPAELKRKLRQARHGGADMVLGTFPSPDDIRWCARTVARLQPEAVLIDTIFRSPLLAEPELKGGNSIIIAHDIFHRRAQAMQAAGYSVQPRELTRATEAVLLGRARSIAAIQPEEAAIISAMCPEAHVFTTPMPALPCPPVVARRIRGRLVFVGSAGLPNLDGMRWFLAEIWPLLAGYGITLDIIGDCGTALRRLPPGVLAHGRVPELAPFLHRASLAIAPLRAGSGLKIKLLDYARHGLTTVVTPPALAGFQPDAAAPFTVAGSAVMFAEAVRRLASDPPPPEAAMDYCVRHYGQEASFAGLAAALHRGGAPPARQRFVSKA